MNYNMVSTSVKRKSYNAENGRKYAEKYYLYGNSYFYKAVVDCTNFVSQCIWAAYGGWYPGISDSELVSNIMNRVSMVSGSYSNSWFANQKEGTKPWENVDALWGFIMKRFWLGPKAIGINYGGNYKNILPSDIKVGDALQFSLDGSDYHHSAYVIKETSVGGSYDDVIVAQRSRNLIRPLSDAIKANGGDSCYMSMMKFEDAVFER